jgi:hypothetical protein
MEDSLIYTLPVTWNLMWWDGRFSDLYRTCDMEFDVVEWEVFWLLPYLWRGIWCGVMGDSCRHRWWTHSRLTPPVTAECERPGCVCSLQQNCYCKCTATRDFFTLWFQGPGPVTLGKTATFVWIWEKQCFSEFTFNSLFYNKANQINLSTTFSKLQFCAREKSWKYSY